MTSHVRIRRAYDAPERIDGYRVLVDRLWPRGLSKEDLPYDAWKKDLAPSPALRKWFGHKVENWAQFRDSYQTELRAPEQIERMKALIAAAKQAGQRTITLVYAAKDAEHNHALILADELNRHYR